MTSSVPRRYPRFPLGAGGCELWRFPGHVPDADRDDNRTPPSKKPRDQVLNKIAGQPGTGRQRHVERSWEQYRTPTSWAVSRLPRRRSSVDLRPGVTPGASGRSPLYVQCASLSRSLSDENWRFRGTSAAGMDPDVKGSPPGELGWWDVIRGHRGPCGTAPAMTVQYTLPLVCDSTGFLESRTEPVNLACPCQGALPKFAS